MSGPGGQEVGRVSVRVLPDTSAFRRSLERFLQRVERTTRLQIRTDLDTANLRRQVDEATRDQQVDVQAQADTTRASRELDGLTHDRTVNVDARVGGAFENDLRKHLKAAAGSLPDVPIKADATDAERKLAMLRYRMAKLSDVDFTVKANADRALTDIAAIRENLKVLNRDSADVTVTANTARAVRELEKVSLEVDHLDGRKAEVKVDIDRSLLDRASNALSRQLAGLGSGGGISSGIRGLVGSFVSLRTAMLAALPAIGPLVSSVVALSGSLAVLPAVGAAAGAGIGALVIGLRGFGKTLVDMGKSPKKFAEDLKNLSPEARKAALAIKGLGPAFGDMRKAVQDKLFAGVADQIKGLATTYLPLMKTGLGGIASEANQAGKQFVAFLKLPQSVKDTKNGLADSKKAFHALTGAVQPLASIFRDIAAVGSSFLPGLAGGFADAAKNAAAFVSHARETGKLKTFIQNGLTAVKDLGTSLLNVGAGLGNIFSISNASGGGFLNTLKTITGAFRDLTAQADVKSGLGDLFKGISDGVKPVVQALGQELGPVIKAVGPVLGEIARQAGQVAVAFVRVAGPLIKQLAPVIGDVAKTLGPALVTTFQQLAPVLQQTLAKLAPALPAIANSVAQLLPGLVSLAQTVLPPLAAILGKLGPAIIPAVAGFKTLRLVMAAGLGGPWAIAIAAVVTGLVALWQTSDKARSVMTLAFDAIKLVVLAFADVALTQFEYVAKVFLSMVDLLVSGAARAFGWVPGIGPKLRAANDAFDNMKTGVIGTMDKMRAGVEGEMKRTIDQTKLQADLVAVSTVSSMTARLPEYQRIASKYGMTLSAVLDAAKLSAKQKAAILADAAAKGISTGDPTMDAAARKLAKLPGSALKTEQGAAAAIARATGQAIADGVSQGMDDRKARVAALAGQLGAVAANAARRGAEVFSPSKITVYAGQMIGQGFIVGMNSKTSAVVVAAGKMTDAMKAAIAKRAADQKALRAAMASLGAKLGASFLLALTGSEKQIKAKVASLTDAIRKSPLPVSAEESAVKILQRGQTSLVKMAQQRVTVAAKLKAAQQKLADAIQARADIVRSAVDNALSFANITNLSGGGATSADLLIAGLKQRLQAIKDYQADLAKLVKKGVNEDIVKQLAAAGVEQGSATADALANASADQIKQINALQGQIGKSATSVGNTIYGALSDAGVKAAQGLVKGLQSQQKAIEAQMLKIAKSMQKAIKAALGIHSPSRVFAALGEQIPNGLVMGIQAQQAKVNSVVGGLVRVPALAAAAGVAGGNSMAVHFNGPIGEHTADEVIRRMETKRRDALASAGLVA